MFFTGIGKLLQRRLTLLATLSGHTGPVISFDICPRGNLLVSGGTDSVKIWDLTAMTEIPLPEQAAYKRSQISCVRWITRKNETFDTLVYGNAVGFLVFLQHRPTEGRFEFVCSTHIARGREILSIAFNSHALGSNVTHIATGTLDKCVQVWVFHTINRTLEPVHSKAYGDDKDIVPKALAFDSNTDHDLYVFGLYDGGLYKYSGKDAKRLAKYQLGSLVGNVVVDVERRICAIDNAGNGFDLYCLDTGNFVKTFPTCEPLKTYPRCVAFANNSHAIVGGSDHGKVYIFDRKTGKVIMTLTHAEVGGVETLAVHDREDGSIILVTASSTTAGPSPIRVWKWLPNEKGGSVEGNEERSTITNWGERLLRIVMVFATVAYFAGVLQDHWQFGYQWPIPLIRNPSILNENDVRQWIQQAVLQGISDGRKGHGKVGNSNKEKI